jgi:ribosomal protein L7/L12
MTINPAQLQVFFFGLLVFFVVLRLIAFGMTRQKMHNETERITRLEQKVDAIMRRLDMQDGSTIPHSNTTSSASPWGSASTASTRADVPAEVWAALQSGNKIAAIKIYRERTGVGLKEAKDAVDQIEQRF